jgi:hypothetical protein
LKVGKSIVSPSAFVSTQLYIAFYETSLVPRDGKANIVKSEPCSFLSLSFCPFTQASITRTEARCHGAKVVFSEESDTGPKEPGGSFLLQPPILLLADKKIQSGSKDSL